MISGLSRSMMKRSRCPRFRGCILLFYFDGHTGNGGGLASLTRTVLPVGRCSTGPVIQRIRTWLLGAEKHFWALYVCIWYTGQALSQLQRLCPALPGVCQPPSSVRGTCIVVPHAALIAVPDAPPRFFAHRARSAPVPLTPPWPHLAKYNAARWLIAARARTPGRSQTGFIGPGNLHSRAACGTPCSS